MPTPIPARPRWTHTGIPLTKGARYFLTANGEWFDWHISTTALGYPTRDAPRSSRWLLALFERARRIPDANWFALVCTVGEDESTAFVMRESPTEWEAPATGELCCFANDHPAAYWNNSGHVDLDVTRIA
ncbi:MAG: hypothetical protein IPF98_04405 [Gemmatimonadetes bacterium]|nr:hypothetical protein [Gemmatimonadota bacterium]